jgi:ferredoxin
VKASVDADVCAGFAHCWALCPEVFELSDAGYAVVIVDEIPAELEDTVRTAVADCPTRAITVT